MRPGRIDNAADTFRAQHARDADIGQDDPLFAYVESMSKICAAVGKDKFDGASKRAAQLETFESIQSKIVPGDVLKVRPIDY